MTQIHTSRQATPAELAAEMDRRGDVIQRLEDAAAGHEARVAELLDANDRYLTRARKAEAALAAKANALTEKDTALAPFARFAENVRDDAWQTTCHTSAVFAWFTPSDFRRAFNALYRAGEL